MSGLRLGLRHLLSNACAGTLRAAVVSAGLLAGTWGAAGGAPAWGADPASAPPATVPGNRDDDRVRAMDRQMERYRGDARAETRPARGGYADRFDDLGNGNGNGNDNNVRDFPLDALHDAVDANVRATAARAAFNRADWNLGLAIRDEERSFENSAEWRAALTDERRAYADLVAARQAAIAKLSANDGRYRAAVALRDEMNLKIAQARWGGEARMAEAMSDPVMLARLNGGLLKESDLRSPNLVAMALNKLAYATTAVSMEVQVTADDARVQEAQQRLLSAGARVSDLRRSHEDQIRTSDRLAAARRALEDARFARVVTAAAAEGAIEVGNEALDYVYWRHRRDYRSYASYDYGYAGYGVLPYSRNVGFRY